MRYVLMVFLFVVFGYALGLVIGNSREVDVNLLFTQAPTMNLGLLIVLCIVLGVLIGMLVALLVFKVLQNKWEIGRLNKENKRLQEELRLANIAIDRQANATPIDQSIYTGNTATEATSTTTTTNSKKPTL